MAEELKGAPVAKAIDERSKADIALLAGKGVTPMLALVRVGAREDDLAYENGAVKRCERVGVASKKVTLPEDVSQEALLAQIDALNRDDTVHGVLLFLPLPKRFDQNAVRAALSPDKDVDGVTDGSLAGVFTGSGEGFAPCTAQACIEILDHYQIDCKGKRAVVVGRSLVVGKPVAMAPYSIRDLSICSHRQFEYFQYVGVLLLLIAFFCGFELRCELVRELPDFAVGARGLLGAGLFGLSGSTGLVVLANDGNFFLDVVVKILTEHFCFVRHLAGTGFRFYDFVQNFYRGHVL